MVESLLLVFACCATAHWIAAAVMSLYARYQTQYLCIAWVDGLFAAGLTLCAFFSDYISEGQPALMHPVMMVFLPPSATRKSDRIAGRYTDGRLPKFGLSPRHLPLPSRQ